MEKHFFAVNSVCNGSEPHEHEIALYTNIGESIVDNKFAKNGLNFYVIFAGTPYITYAHNSSTEHLTEVERIKNYIDSLPTAYIDYDESSLSLKIYYYSQDLPTNQWLDYDNGWQSDILPCVVMQGPQSMLMSQYSTSTPGSYHLKYAVIDGSIEMNSSTTKLVFVNGVDVSINGKAYVGHAEELVEGNLSITSTGTAYVTVIEDAV